MDKQVKTRQRVADHGEVFTSEREVNAMLDLVKQETERIDSRFLEPACGNGNFLAEVLRRKLKIVDSRYRKSQSEWELYAVIAVSSIYGMDILKDNAQECRDRLLGIFTDWYTETFNQVKSECIRTVRFLLERNIIHGDALTFKNPDTNEPIIFSEWSAVNGSLIKRIDYRLQFLVESTHQFSLFDEEGMPAAIDQPVKEYPLINFLKLGEDDTN